MVLAVGRPGGGTVEVLKSFLPCRDVPPPHVFPKVKACGFLEPQAEVVIKVGTERRALQSSKTVIIPVPGIERGTPWIQGSSRAEVRGVRRPLEEM
jgi:hypothetical protein